VRELRTRETNYGKGIMGGQFKVGALALVTGAVALPHAAQAEDYRWEIGANDAGFSVHDQDLDFYGLYGTYYFQDVKTDTLPLQEAAYLERVGSVSLAPSRFDFSSRFATGHFDQLRLTSELYLPKNWLYLAAGITHSDTLEPTYNGGTIIDSSREHDTSWDATIGITPFDGLRLSTTYFQHTDYRANLDAKYVGKLGNDHYYGLGLHLLDPEQGSLVYSLSGDYFIDRTLRVGGEFGEHHWGVSADKFFMDKLDVGLHYVDRDEDGGHTLAFRIAWRF
jgi:hypothetical protein